MVIDPVRLEIHNFRKLDEFEFDFTTAPLVLIQGPNGSGKTSIFEAIYCCLYNRRPDGRPASAAIRKGQKSARLIFECDIDGIRYIFDRTIGRGAKFHITVDGETRENTTENKSYAESLISPDVVKLSMLKPIKVRDLFANILNMDDFILKVRQAISDKVEPKINECKNEISKIIGSRQVLEGNIENYKNMLQNLKSQYQAIKKELETLNVNFDTSDLADASNRVVQFEKEISEIFYAQQDELKTQVNNLNNTLYQIQFKIKELQSQITKNKNFLGNGICPTCGQNLPSEMVDGINQQISEAEREIETLNENSKQMSQERDEINKQIKELASSDWYVQTRNELLAKYNLTEEMINQIKNESQLLKKKIDLEAKLRDITSNASFYKQELQKAQDALMNHDNSAIKQYEDEIARLEKIREDLELWTDTRVFKRAITKTVSSALNTTAQKYTRSLLDMDLDLDDKGELQVSVTNVNGEIVPISDLSRGETVMATLVLHLAIRDFISPTTDFRCIFLDEFLDSLDEENSERVILFLRDLSEKLKILVISHMNQNPDLFDFVLNMER